MMRITDIKCVCPVCQSFYVDGRKKKCDYCTAELRFVMRFRKIIYNDNPLPTIKAQIMFGFTKEEAIQNLRDSEREYYIKEEGS